MIAQTSGRSSSVASLIRASDTSVRTQIDVVLFQAFRELPTFCSQRQPRREHPPLGVVVVLDVDVRNLVHRVIERSSPGNETTTFVAHGPQPEKPLAHHVANDVQGFVLYLRRCCRPIAMSDMPIHGIEVHRFTQALNQQSVAYLGARFAHPSYRTGSA